MAAVLAISFVGILTLAVLGISFAVCFLKESGGTRQGVVGMVAIAGSTALVMLMCSEVACRMIAWAWGGR